MIAAVLLFLVCLLVLLPCERIEPYEYDEIIDIDGKKLVKFKRKNDVED